MKRLLLIGLVVLAAYFAGDGFGPARGPSGNAGLSSPDADRVLSSAFAAQRSDVQVRGGGQVTRILPDDTVGSRHQRFIVTLRSGQTLLVAHNIDLAERIAGLASGDYVEFNGEYEWNERGGIIHWTHHDPQGRHVAGWIQHNGRTYQ